ncbi:hypothetical protein [Hymenobacter negativus]|uniref:NRDE family protein n=1 Tax=Hymenobacter negativus TaxID=2795026 RepID=A0ABS3QAC5_9BACT|nr:hypothetical protein [Hymenobacter negativus]MBO2008201.1 hypothetical protein [Hymenobacter negativus]
MLIAPNYLPATPVLLYDGFEANWWTQPLLLPRRGGGTFAALLGTDAQPIRNASAWLSKDDFQQVLRDVRAQVRDWSGQGDMVYLGYNDLHLQCVRDGNELWVIAAGERQPARYQTFLHGSWPLA